MQTDETLAPDLTWQPDGHVTEVALTMIADGEHALVLPGAIAHVDACEACSARLGSAAMLSLRVADEAPLLAEALARATPVPVSSPRTRPLPVGAIAVALALAALGAAPSLAEVPERLPGLLASVVRLAPMLMRSAVVLVESAPSEIAPALSWVTAAFLMMTGLGVARAMSRGRSLQGGT